MRGSQQANARDTDIVDPMYLMLEGIIAISDSKPKEALKRSKMMLGVNDIITLDPLLLARVHETRGYAYFALNEIDKAIEAATLARQIRNSKVQDHGNEARITLMEKCRKFSSDLLTECQVRKTALESPCEPIHLRTACSLADKA